MNNDRHLLMSSLAVVGAIALTAFLFVIPNYRQAGAMQQEVIALRDRIAGLETQSKALDELNSEIASVQNVIDTRMKAIPETPDLANVIRSLSQEVDRINVMDQTFTAGSPADALPDLGKNRGPEKPKPPGASNEPSANTQSAFAMPLTVDMEARFEAIFDLIRSAESMQRLIRIASIRMVCKRDDKQASSSPIIKASVGLEAIYLAPASSTTK